MSYRDIHSPSKTSAPAAETITTFTTQRIGRARHSQTAIRTTVAAPYSDLVRIDAPASRPAVNAVLLVGWARATNTTTAVNSRAARCSVPSTGPYAMAPGYRHIAATDNVAKRGRSNRDAATAATTIAPHSSSVPRTAPSSGCTPKTEYSAASTTGQPGSQ